MRKLTKVLSAVLLLAIVVSAFAMFSTFAAEGEAESNATSVVYDGSQRVVCYNTNTLTTAPALANAGAGDTITLVKEGDTVILKQTHSTTDAQDFWTISVAKPTVGQADDAKSIVIADIVQASTVNKVLTPTLTESGEYTTTIEKNTDFMIIDFDISTDSTFIDYLYFHSRFYRNDLSSTLAKVIQDSSKYPTINRNNKGTDEFTIGVDNKSAVQYAPLYESGNKWINVTIVYDTRADFDHASVEAGTAFTGHLGYVYIDGYFVGSVAANWTRYNKSDLASASLQYAKAFESFRVSTSGTSAEGSTTNWANFTVSRFPVGYDGPLTTSLGDANLAQLSDMAWTQENTPANPEGYAESKTAEIVRTVDGEEKIIPVYSEDYISGNLLEGDKIVVYKKLFNAVAFKGDATTLTWVDAAGEAITPPKVLTVNADSDWAIIAGGAIKAQGSASAITAKRPDLNGDGKATTLYKDADGNYSLTQDETFTTKVTTETGSWIVDDPLYIAIRANCKTNNSKVVLFGDVTSYGAGSKNVGSTNTSAWNPATGIKVTFDLNGYNFDATPLAGHYVQINSGVKTCVEFIDGNLTYSGTAGNLYMINSGNSGSTVLFKDLDLNLRNTGTVADQRDGNVVFYDCDVTLAQDLMLRSSNKNGSAMSIIDSKFELTDSVGFLLDNIKSSEGSHVVSLRAINSEIISTYSSASTSAFVFKLNPAVDTVNTGARALNDNYAKIDIIDSDIVADNTLGASYIFCESANSTNASTLLKYENEINIIGSTLKADNMLYTSITDGGKNTYEYDSYISADAGSKIIADTLTAYNSSARFVNIVIDLADGTKLGSTSYTSSTQYAPIVNVPDGAKVANTSLDEEAGYVVTTNYDTYTYKLGNKAAETFYWNQAEGEQVDINKVVTTAETALYKYTWANEGKAYTANMVSKLALSAKSNLTLCDYIYFNLFINKAQYDAAIAAGATVSGITVDASTEIINIDGTDYYKLQIKNIKLEDADKAVMTVDVSFAGAYDDSYASEKSFSVLGYAENILNKSTDEKSVALIESLLNYIVAACNYASVDASAVAEKAAALIEGKEFGAIAGEAKAETLNGVEVAIRYGSVLYLGVKANAGDVITVSYTSADDNAVSVTKTADENGEIYVAIKAYDFASDLTITRGADSATMNIQGYYNALAGNEAAQKMVAAIYNYSVAAAAYKATIAN